MKRVVIIDAKDFDDAISWITEAGCTLASMRRTEKSANAQWQLENGLKKLTKEPDIERKVRTMNSVTYSDY